MATTTDTQLPAISNLQISARREPQEGQRETRDGGDAGSSRGNDDENLAKAVSFLGRFGLGTVQKQLRPGDVYKGRPQTTSAALPRPLGLLPDRGDRLSALKRLTQVLSPLPTQPPASAPVFGFRAGGYVDGATREKVETKDEGDQQLFQDHAKPRGGLISAVANLKSGGIGSGEEGDAEVKDTSHSLANKGTGGLSTATGTIPFRLSATAVSLSPPQQTKKQSMSYPLELQLPSLPLPGAKPDDHVPNLLPLAAVEDTQDREYMDTLAKCNIKEYGISEPLHVLPPMATVRRSKTLPATGVHGLISRDQSATTGVPSQSRRVKLGRQHNRSSSLQYVNFIGQAQLSSRLRTLDCRDAKDYIPCERCRLRGGRCHKCKALRTGGGYIILDGTDVSETDLLRRYGRGGYGLGDGMLSGHGAGIRAKLRRRRRPSAKTDVSAGGGKLTSGSGFGDLGKGERVTSGIGGRGNGWDGGEGGGGDRGVGPGGGDGGRDGRTGSTYDGSGEGTGVQGRRSGMGGGQSDEDGRGFYGDDSLGKGRMGSARPIGTGGGRGEGTDNFDGYDSGRQSSTSQRPGSVLGSRPESRFGSRPGSSMRKFGRGFERRERERRGVELEKRSQGSRVRRRDGEGGEEGGDSDDEARRRRRRKGPDDEDDDSRERHERYQHLRGDEEEEEAERGRYTGDLMRFKPRRDDVKALKCTLKELQGIDPLDYLAKYCIIDQEKLPNYRRVYDNVDRDEDDEISISELDFALKAVNYNLISDAEMNYVHSVLELAGRYRLNFRLFSLIAALSEKVVALEDMVKRLINKMDFEATEVKIKKCKELFYLLADAESLEQEGGVVSVSSLAVELQAGGLTQDHVEFVVDRLNHQGKGIVEFLDYLTYVPLFVEIHDSIYGNPLDFSRTK